MPGESEQLATLGEKVLNAVVQTYLPTDNKGVALALHPGKPLADDIVQNGSTNTLRLSEWIENEYDFPVQLKLADSTPLMPLGSLSAKAAYVGMVEFAQPSVPPDHPAYARLSALIADARRALGEHPDALPFGCEPTNFAETASLGWHVFDQKIATSVTVVTSQPGEGGPTRINPQLWKLRALDGAMVRKLPSSSDVARRRMDLNSATLKMSGDDRISRFRHLKRESLQVPSVNKEVVGASKFLQGDSFKAKSALASSWGGRLGAKKLSVLGGFRSKVGVELAEPVIETAPSPSVMFLDPNIVDRLLQLRVSDLAVTPSVSEVTTDTSLHAHFEYCLVTISRELAGIPWWHSMLLAEDDWYVPGMKRGDMVPDPDEISHAYCLPQALLVVRNVSFTGKWNSEARASLAGQLSFLGPFLIQASPALTSAESATQEIQVLGTGIQVIGELCTVLPTLPPRDAPDI